PSPTHGPSRMCLKATGTALRSSYPRAHDGAAQSHSVTVTWAILMVYSCWCKSTLTVIRCFRNRVYQCQSFPATAATPHRPVQSDHVFIHDTQTRQRQEHTAPSQRKAGMARTVACDLLSLPGKYDMPTVARFGAAALQGRIERIDFSLTTEAKDVRSAGFGLDCAPGLELPSQAALVISSSTG